MTDKPEALRLADALMEPVVLDKHAMQAAAELRRLHRINEELVMALSFYAETALVADIALAAIAKATGEQS